VGVMGRERRQRYYNLGKRRRWRNGLGGEKELGESDVARDCRRRDDFGARAVGIQVVAEIIAAVVGGVVGGEERGGEGKGGATVARSYRGGIPDLGGGDEVTGAGGGGGGEAPGQPARCGRGAWATSTVVHARERSPGGTGAAARAAGSLRTGGAYRGARAPGLAAGAGGWRAWSAGCAGAGARCGRGASEEGGGRARSGMLGRRPERLAKEGGDCRREKEGGDCELSFFACLREGRTRSQVPGRRKNQTFFCTKRCPHFGLFSCRRL